MQQPEAKMVYSYVNSDLVSASVDLRQIGNGEYIVVVDKYFYLWSMNDWLSNCHLWLGSKSSYTVARQLDKPRHTRDGRSRRQPQPIN